MKITSEINILGGLPDWNLINFFLTENSNSVSHSGGLHSYTAIKTNKAIKRFERAISGTLIKFFNPEIETLVRDIFNAESVSHDSLLLLFWNASFNNDLLDYLNNQIYFLSFFGGRIAIKKYEVCACLKDLQERESELKKWSDSTLQITASKYLTLLKKFNLLEGSLNKTIVHPYLNDKMLVLFIYWIKAIESRPNLLESEWLKYSFCERNILVERIMQKKFSEYFQFIHTGDKLKIETLVPYENIYHAIK
jgi:hypothetical protein